ITVPRLGARLAPRARGCLLCRGEHRHALCWIGGHFESLCDPRKHHVITHGNGCLDQLSGREVREGGCEYGGGHTDILDPCPVECEQSAVRLVETRCVEA